MTGWAQRDAERQEDEYSEQNEPEERRCDLCKYEKDLPCSDKGCNSVNVLKDFEPKGTETENTGCGQCEFWLAVKIGKFCPDCGQALK